MFRLPRRILRSDIRKQVLILVTETTYVMAEILFQNGLLTGTLLLGVLALAVVLSRGIGLTANTPASPPNYNKRARTHAERVHGYDNLTDHQQEFLRECAADFLQRGYHLNAKIDRLEVTTANGPRACLIITEDTTIEMLAYVEPDGWQQIDPDPADCSESASKLKARQRRLNEYL